MDLGLSGRVALVAASSQGLGRAVAEALAREGASLALCSRGPSIEHTAAHIRSTTGAQVFAAAVDVTDAAQVQRFVHHTVERFGRVDICVANAGGPPSKAFADTSLDEWRDAIDLNLMSTVHLARETLPAMKERRWGRFIAITSVSVKQPLEGLGLSNSVRSAVSGLIKTLANEYGPYNVLVNSVCPGFTATARLQALSAQLASAQGVPEADIQRRWTSQIPLGRLGRPEEFADAVAFLASERASYINGVSLAIDGGMVKAAF